MEDPTLQTLENSIIRSTCDIKDRLLKISKLLRTIEPQNQGYLYWLARQELERVATALTTILEHIGSQDPSGGTDMNDSQQSSSMTSTPGFRSILCSDSATGIPSKLKSKVDFENSLLAQSLSPPTNTTTSGGQQLQTNDCEQLLSEESIASWSSLAKKNK